MLLTWLPIDWMLQVIRVVGMGTCTVHGGIFGENYESCGGVSEILPVDQFADGCPPPPVEILHGILSAVPLRYGVKVSGNSTEQGRNP